MFATQEASRFLRFANDSYGRRVYLGNNFNPADLERVSSELKAFSIQGTEPIVLEIDSDGGDFQAANTLAELIPQLRAPVYGLVVGNCYSSAFHILQACKVRLVLPTASLIFHNNFKKVMITTTADMNLEFVMNYLAKEKIERAKSREVILSAMKKRNVRYDREQLLAMMREEKMLTADGALERGFIDEIVRY